MLEKTENTLKRFREINRDSFYETAREFKPMDPYKQNGGSYYGDFDEVTEIYQVMYSLYLQLDQQIFIGHFEKAYSNPMEPISSVLELSQYINSGITRLEELNEKYDDALMPVKFTLENYRKTAKVINYVLELKEIKDEIGDPEKETLRNELISIKINKQIIKKRLNLIGIAAFYFIFLIGPVVTIILMWDKHSNAKYFQLGLVIFPIIGFLYDRKSFIELFKFCFSKKYRQEIRLNIKRGVKENYA